MDSLAGEKDSWSFARPSAIARPEGTATGNQIGGFNGVTALDEEHLP